MGSLPLLGVVLNTHGRIGVRQSEQSLCVSGNILLYVFSGLILLLLDQILSLETCLGSSCSVDMFQGSTIILGQAILTRNGTPDLPARPIWYRLALSWIPRYLILCTILGTYLAVYRELYSRSLFALSRLFFVSQGMFREQSTPKTGRTIQFIPKEIC